MSFEDFVWGSCEGRPGYRVPVHKVYTLQKRLNMALDSHYAAELQHLLWKYGVSYQIETSFDIIKYVAFLDKPLAEILDELRIPRDWEGTEFIEFVGPSPLFYGPPRRPLVQPVLRKITPGLMKLDALGVQPLTKPVDLLMTLRFKPEPLTIEALS